MKKTNNVHAHFISKFLAGILLQAPVKILGNGLAAGC